LGIGKWGWSFPSGKSGVSRRVLSKSCPKENHGSKKSHQLTSAMIQLLPASINQPYSVKLNGLDYTLNPDELLSCELSGFPRDFARSRICNHGRAFNVSSLSVSNRAAGSVK
jgi:hypothetical protein